MKSATKWLHSLIWQVFACVTLEPSWFPRGQAWPASCLWEPSADGCWMARLAEHHGSISGWQRKGRASEAAHSPACRQPTHTHAHTYTQICANTLHSQTLFHYRMELFHADDHQVYGNRDDIHSVERGGLTGIWFCVLELSKSSIAHSLDFFSILFSPTHTNTHTHTRVRADTFAHGGRVLPDGLLSELPVT